MTSPTRWAVALLMTVLLLTARTVLATAATPSAYAAEPAVALPPLPEWPIIGPLLLRLGIVEQTPEPAPLPNPNLPEYRISTLDDLNQLGGVGAGERIRVIASEASVNNMVQEALAQQGADDASFWIDFAPNEATVEASADASLVERADVNLPAIMRGNLRVSVAFSAGADTCLPSVDLRSVSVNSWRVGLRALVQRMVDERIAQVWPAEICIERILLMDGEAAVEGYRVP